MKLTLETNQYLVVELLKLTASFAYYCVLFEYFIPQSLFSLYRSLGRNLCELSQILNVSINKDY